jgi:FHS family Na+ dependent glucose MFS transporter 1
MNAMHFFFGTGAFVAPFLVAQTTGAAAGYRWAFWILAGVAGLVGLRLLAMRGTPRAAHSAETETSANGISRGDVPFIISATLFLFFYVGAEVAFGGWVYTYALLRGLATAAGAAYLTSAFWLSFTVGRLLSIPLAARFRPRTIVVTGLLACLGVLGLMVLRPGSSAVLWAVAVGLGFCMAPLWPTGFTLAGQSLRTNGRLIGIILLGDSVGAMVLPSAAGKVIDAAGPGALAYLVFGSLVCALAAFGAMLRGKAPPPLPQSRLPSLSPPPLP